MTNHACQVYNSQNMSDYERQHKQLPKQVDVRAEGKTRLSLEMGG